MDMAMLDVSAVEGAAVGDEVVAIGRQGGEAVTACGLAELAGTIPYEITTLLTGRVPRVYL
jgi:alanine racemase